MDRKRETDAQNLTADDLGLSCLVVHDIGGARLCAGHCIPCLQWTTRLCTMPSGTLQGPVILDQAGRHTEVPPTRSARKTVCTMIMGLAVHRNALPRLLLDPDLGLCDLYMQSCFVR